MNMTTEEMKLAVASKLPELIYTYYSPPMFHWRFGVRSGKDIHWPTEGLQVCREAEKLLTIPQKWQYMAVLMLVVANKEPGANYTPAEWERFINAQIKFPAVWPLVFSNHEQRLEALCRVWFPERFTI